MHPPARPTSIALLLLLGACATVPTGPSVMALPGSGRSYDQFRGADAECRQFALVQVGGRTPGQAVTQQGVESAALGTTLGAVTGAAINGQQGAAIGAGMGLLAGSLAGIEAGQASAHGLQRRYDNAYLQCMYAKGDRVPVTGQLSPSPSGITTPPASAYLPPPPPAYPGPR